MNVWTIDQWICSLDQAQLYNTILSGDSGFCIIQIA